MGPSLLTCEVGHGLCSYNITIQQSKSKLLVEFKRPNITSKRDLYLKKPSLLVWCRIYCINWQSLWRLWKDILFHVEVELGVSLTKRKKERRKRRKEIGKKKEREKKIMEERHLLLFSPFNVTLKWVKISFLLLIWNNMPCKSTFLIWKPFWT